MIHPRFFVPLKLNFTASSALLAMLLFLTAVASAHATIIVPPSGPKEFDIIVNLTTPFFYNPKLGSLLMDVRNVGRGTTTQFDAESTAGDSISRVYTVFASGGGVGATMADRGDTGGLVT